MTAIPNPLTAVRNYLLADGPLFDLVTRRVFAGELPKTEANSMPRGAIVVSLAGGGGPASDAPIMLLTVDIACYGATGLGATTVYLALRRALRDLRRETVTASLLHSAVELSGPLELRDFDTGWPLTFSSWRIHAGEN